MKYDFKKIIKDLTEYLENMRLREEINTLEDSENDLMEANFESLAYCPCESDLNTEPCANYSDYEDFRDELSSLLERKVTGETMFDLVEKHLKEKGMKPSEAYRNAQISKQDFARYVRPNADSISRTMVFNLALGLRLDCDETKKLLRSAGYGYNKKSKFDLIVMFCINKKLYDVTFVNMLLYEFNQPLLKSRNNKEI